MRRRVACKPLRRTGSRRTGSVVGVSLLLPARYVRYSCPPPLSFSAVCHPCPDPSAFSVAHFFFVVFLASGRFLRPIIRISSRSLYLFLVFRLYDVRAPAVHSREIPPRNRIKGLEGKERRGLWGEGAATRKRHGL